MTRREKEDAQQKKKGGAVKAKKEKWLARNSPNYEVRWVVVRRTCPKSQIGEC